MPESTRLTAESPRFRLPKSPLTGLKISGAWVLSALILLFVASPIIDEAKAGELVESILLVLVVFASVLAIGQTRRTLIVAILLAIPAVGGRAINWMFPGLLPPSIYTIGSMALMVYIVFHLLRFIMLARKVDSNVLCTGLAAYLMIALLWSIAYNMAERLIPGSFTFTVSGDPNRHMHGFNSLYFSLITLCTVGYGDIVPSSGVSRMLAMMEGTAGVFYVAVIVARLMSLYQTENLSERKDGGNAAS